MSDNPLPALSASKNISEPPTAPPQTPLPGGCERRGFFCGCCKAFGCLFVVAIVLAICAFIGWRLLSPKYTAKSYIQLHFRKDSMLSSNSQQTDEKEYELFKKTQMEYVSSAFVLKAALHKPEDSPISRLPIIRKQDDPVAWLHKHLRVSFPLNGEVMEVSLAADDPDDAAKIVTAVVEAYKSEVADAEMDKRRARLNEIERLYTDKDQEVRNKRNDLRQLAEQLGTAETETLNLKQKLVLEELATFRNQLAQRDFEIGRMRTELASRQAELKAVQSADISDLECELFAQSDPVLKTLIQEIMWRKIGKPSASQTQTPEDKSNKGADKNQFNLEELTTAYSERIKQIREEVLHKRQTDVEKEINRLEAAIEIANKQQKANEDQMQHLKKMAEQFGSSSVDVEMLRAEINVREKSLEALAAERDKLRIELRSPPRIEIMQKKAEVEKRSPLIFLP
jgi:polysaccharide biosynthesis transport protein